jgi:hypothetical protein
VDTLIFVVRVVGGLSSCAMPTAVARDAPSEDPTASAVDDPGAEAIADPWEVPAPVARTIAIAASRA